MGFADISSRLVGDLQRDFGFTRAQSVGVAGQLAHETSGFRQLQEQRPLIPGSAGGYGFAQWTGSRRQEYLGWAQEKGLDPTSYDANYGFLKTELESGKQSRSVWGGGANTVDLIKSGGDDSSIAGRVFTNDFLRPGVPGYASRQQWTQKVANVAGEGENNPIGAYDAGKEKSQNAAAERDLPKAVVRAGEQESEAALRAANSQTASDQKIAERNVGLWGKATNFLLGGAADYLTRFFLVLLAIVLIAGGIFLFSKGYIKLPESVETAIKRRRI